MASTYTTSAVFESLISGSTVSKTSGSATLFAATGSDSHSTLYFFKGDGTQVDLAGSNTLTADGDTGGTVSVDLSTDTFDFAGGDGCDTVIAKSGTDVTLTINLDLGELTEAAIDVSADYGVFLDGGATGSTRKDSWADIATAQAGTVTTTGLAASSGVFNWDLENWTASTTIADADLVGVDDGANGTLRKMTRGNLLGSAKASFDNGMEATTMSGSSTLKAGGLITGNAGLTVTAGTTILSGGLDMAEGNITNVGDVNCDSVSVDAAGTGLNVDFSGGNTGVNLISMGASLASALDIKQNGGDSYLKFLTNNEYMEAGKEMAFQAGASIAEDSWIRFGDDASNSDASLYVSDDSFVISGSISGSAGYGSTWVSGTLDVERELIVEAGGITVDAGGLTVTAGGVTVTAGGLDMNDTNISNVGVIECDTVQSDADAAGLNINFDGNTGTNLISMANSLASALDINQGGTSFLKFDTTNDYIAAGKEIAGEAGISVAEDSWFRFGDNSSDSDAQLFVDGGGYLVVSGSSISGVGSTYVSGTLDTSGELTVEAGGITVDAGGLTVTAGTTAVAALTATTISGSSTLQAGGLITGNNGLTIHGAGATITEGGLTVTAGGATVTAGGLEVVAGGIDISGNSEILDGTFAVGESTDGYDVTFYGTNANDLLLWDASENALVVKDNNTEIVRMGGDATTDYAIDVGNGSAGTNAINKIRASAFVTFSDERLKSDVTPMKGALSAVNSMKPVDFTWKSDGSRDFGFIAQNIKSVVPRAVHGDEEGLYGVDYGRLTSILVSAIQEQTLEIEALKAKIEDK